MPHIVTCFVADKYYFFYQDQRFSMKWLFAKLVEIVKNNRQSVIGNILLLCGCGAFLLSKYLLKESNVFSAIEGIILILIIASCIMDVKTMSIDYFLSYIICALLLLNVTLSSSITFERVLFAGIGIFILCTTIFIYEKCAKKEIIGGADIDFFIGMFVYFNYSKLILFFLFSLIFGLITNLLIKRFSVNRSSLKSGFPFLPGISVAFYFIRYLPCLDNVVFDIF